MKELILILALSMSLHALQAETTLSTAPITGDDLASILHLSTSKTKVSFDTPKHVVLRFESEGASTDLPIKGWSKSVTLLTYIPAEGGAIKPLYYWISGAGGTYSSAFSIDSSKAKFTRSGMVDGIFTISASETEDFKGAPVYRMQILTPDK